MNEIKIAKLVTVGVREAWANEAFDFTPWLFQNLDALGEAIGIQLEPEGAEVAVETFSADILARNKFDGTAVLIENQLECSDHGHLGQIMTYLAGLDAKTVVWVAADFREAHLSAINWLNENTDESISFFAVRLRVVRIADSPLAPIFDVVARPNNWERRLHAATANRGGKSEIAQQRFAFWQAFVDKIPGEFERGGAASYTSNRWRIVEHPPAIVSLYTSVNSVGVFLRQPHYGSLEEFREVIEPKVDLLAAKLGVPMGNQQGGFFVSSMRGDYKDPNQRDQLIGFLAEKADLYERALKEIF